MIDAISTKWNEASTGQKAAMVGGAVAAGTAVVATGYAAYHGKVDGNSIKDVFTKEGAATGIVDKFKKTGSAMVDGYKQFGTAVKTKASNAWKAVKGFFSSNETKAENATGGAAEGTGSIAGGAA